MVKDDTPGGVENAAADSRTYSNTQMRRKK